MGASPGVLGSVLFVAGSEAGRMYAEYCAWRGVEVRVVGAAADAIRELAAALPDAVVISERLPDCTGHDLVRALRRSRHTFDLCLILLASNTFAQEAGGNARQACDLVLTVPVLPNELVDALERLLRTRAARRRARPFESRLFRRGGESVWIVRTAPLELAVAGPRERRAAFQFDAEPDLLRFQADYEERLQQTGFVLESSGVDRRSGRERRGGPRNGNERRAIQ